jgi:hypothetical protein
LNDLSVALKVQHGVEIRKQSLHERFNQYAYVFLKVALEELIQKQVVLPQRFNPRCFRRILIKDSTCFQIDESLEAYYPGSGGSGSGASIRIQFEYDFLGGKIVDLSMNAFNDQDATNSVETIELTSAGDIIIRDLAYMSIEVLQAIAKRSAFYLCRPSPSTNIYEMKSDTYCKLDFVGLFKYMQKNGIETLEREVYLGAKELFKTRMALHLLPQNVVATRIRKAREANKKKGRGELTAEYIARAHLNLFVTNTTIEQLSTRDTWQLYRLRWQIELVFKVWKTICQIHRVKKVNRYRLECYVLSRLILIMLGWQVIWIAAVCLYQAEGKVISFFKAAKTLFREYIGDLARLFLLRTSALGAFIKDFCTLSRSNHLLEKRQKRPSSFELLISSLYPGGRES